MAMMNMINIILITMMNVILITMMDMVLITMMSMILITMMILMMIVRNFVKNNHNFRFGLPNPYLSPGLAQVNIVQNALFL